MTATRYAALTLNWGNNLGNYEGGSQLTIQLYRGDFTDESLPLDEQALVATYTADKGATSFQIPAGVLSELNQDSSVNYTVVISAANPQAEGEILSDRQGILLKAQPVTAKLIRPDTLYYTDLDASVEIGWELNGLAQGQNATFMVQRVRADNSTETYATQLLSEAEDSYSLSLAPVEDGLKDIYQVTLTVDNGEQAPSTDSFALHVYNHSALKIVDENGTDLSVLNMGNEDTVTGYPDIGISQMKVLEEKAGKRTIAVTLFNAADATLAGNKGRTVKLAFFTDNLLEDKAPVGINGGTSATTFSPDDMVTRGQTVMFLWRYAGSPEASASSFTDVDANAYYATAVAWAAKEGVTSGTSSTTFSPDAPCTRAQIVTFLYRVR